VQATSDVYLKQNGGSAVSEDINLSKHKLMHLGEPAADNDAVTRKYVEHISGMMQFSND
jgi:hypothetical protein